jgi:hypothetical protein
LASPAASLLAIADDGHPDGPDIKVVADEMAVRGWPVQTQPARLGGPATLHVTMTGAVADLLDALVEALAEAVDSARPRGRARPDPALVGVAAGLDPASLDDAALDAVLAAAGVAGAGGVGLPTRMADVNALLEALPVPLAETLLAALVSRVYRR